MGEDYTALNDATHYQRINSLFLKIKNCDVVIGGLRTAESAKLLANFKFGRKEAVDNLPVISSLENRISIRKLHKANDLKIVEMQVDFSAGKFRRFEHSLPDLGGNSEVFVKKRSAEERVF